MVMLKKKSEEGPEFTLKYMFGNRIYIHFKMYKIKILFSVFNESGLLRLRK